MWQGKEDLSLSLVKSGGRPDYQLATTPAPIKELIVKCWEQEPEARPKFAQIVEDIRKVQLAG